MKIFFNVKHKDCEILLQINIHKRPFLNHKNDKSKGYAMMVSSTERDSEGDVFMHPRASRILTR